MPRQNRVLPTGEIVAHPAHGLFMGNRGVLHDASGELTAKRWAHQNWVCCLTAFKNRKRPLMQPNRYTELFFLDEAVAFAAGHRPCAECRRADYTAFRAALDQPGKAADLDRHLHAARAIPRRAQLRRHEAEAQDLPTGAMILDSDGRPLLLTENAAWPCAPDGYGPPHPRPSGRVTLLTPPPYLEAFRNGYSPRLHPSAQIG